MLPQRCGKGEHHQGVGQRREGAEGQQGGDASLPCGAHYERGERCQAEAGLNRSHPEGMRLCR